VVKSGDHRWVGKDDRFGRVNHWESFGNGSIMLFEPICSGCRPAL
jgi:hypothetical protein